MLSELDSYEKFECLDELINHEWSPTSKNMRLSLNSISDKKFSFDVEEVKKQ